MTNSKLKDSNIEWLGKIPSNWRLIHNKYILKKKKEILSKYDNEKILSLTMNGVIERDLNAGGKMPSSFDGYQKLKKDNLLLCLFDIDVTPRCVGIIPKDGITSPAYSQFILNKKEAYLKYYYYYFLMLDNKKVLVHLSKNLRNTLSEQEFGSLTSLMPPLEEQKKISTFLDKKIGKIDKVSKKIQQEITDLEKYRKSIITKAVTKGLNPNVPMKDSGIPWIGKIPQKWELEKARFSIKISNGADPIEDSGPTPVYGSGKNSFRTTTSYKEGPAVLLGRKGSISNPIWVKGHYWNVDTAFDAKSNGKINLKYYYYCSICFDYGFYTTQTALPSMTQAEYYNMHLPFPNLKEQDAIVKFLDKKEKQINNILTKKKILLKRFNQYKQSIIYEYVTGKKPVPTEEGVQE